MVKEVRNNNDHLMKCEQNGNKLAEEKVGAIVSFIIFTYFKEGGPSASAGLQGALHLQYTIYP